MIAFLLNQVARVKPYIRDTGGSRLYGDEYEIKCRIDIGKKLVKAITVHGDVTAVIANAILFVKQEMPIPPESLVTHGNRSYKVIRCDEMRGFSSSHLEVYLE